VAPPRSDQVCGPKRLEPDAQPAPALQSDSERSIGRQTSVQKGIFAMKGLSTWRRRLPRFPAASAANLGTSCTAVEQLTF
jgi:hypothetical protein